MVKANAPGSPVPIEIRPYRSGDEVGIIKLFEEVFRKSKDLARWRWYYENGPHGPAITEVALHKGRIIGHYSGIPGKFQIGTSTHLAFLPSDTMVHEDYRDLKTFLTLVQRVYKRCVEKGICLVYGFPNEMSAVPFNKFLRWKLFEDISALELPLSHLQGFGLPRAGVFIRAVERFDQNLDPLWRRSIPMEKLSLIRDSTYLNWRYVDKPSVKYYRFLAQDLRGLPLGYAVGKIFIQEKGIGDIMDIAATGDSREAVFKSLAQELIKTLADEGAEHATSWYPTYHEGYRFLLDLGFRPTGPKTRFGYRLLIPGALEESRLMDRSAWHVTMGDSDVF